MDHYSPLRFPGGKAKITHYFKLIFKENFLYDGIYIEPYAGGASIALSLLFNEYASKVIINDLDISIYAFWYSVINLTDDLCKLIKDALISLSIWDKQRDIQRDKVNQDLLKLGFSTFYLNRTNMSGIINAGIIGGRNQAGKWKIDARFNKLELINRIQRIALYKNRIDLFNMDAIDLVKRMKKIMPKKSLFYFDPPYYVKGKDLYLNYYKKDDHKLISDEVKKIKLQKWIVTYDNVDFIKQLYKDYRQNTFKLKYSALKPTIAEELIIYSNNIHLPPPSLISVES